MGKDKKLPIYKMVITDDESTGVDFISLVDYPAIEVNWVAFNNKTIKCNFNQDKRIITGPAMIPDMKIYRYDQDMGEYYVVFEKDQVEKAAKKFLKEGKTLAFNYQHENDSQVSGTQIFETWMITDKENDKSNAFGFDLPVGTWMVSCYVENEKFWNEEVKTGKVRGYSIEGFLNMELSKIKNKQTMAQKVKLAEVKTQDGLVIYTDAEAMTVDVEVYGMDVDGNRTQIADGEYTLESGDVVVIAGNKVAEIKPAEESQEDMTAEIKATIESFVTPIMQPLMDSVAELTKQINDLKAENAKLNVELSKIPGTSGITKDDKKITDAKDKSASFEDKIKKIAELRKQNNK